MVTAPFNGKNRAVHPLMPLYKKTEATSIFSLAGEYYGVDIAVVEGIIKLQVITAVPRAPAFVEGVTNLRGSVLPVMDLRTRFGLGKQVATKDTRIVVVEIGGGKVGMVVDAVSEVLRVGDENIEAASPMITTADSAFIKGIAKMDGRLMILVDLARALTVGEQAELRQLDQAA